MKKILSLAVLLLISLNIYGFDSVFLSNLSPASLINAKYNYTATNYRGNTVNGILQANVQKRDEILVTLKIGDKKKSALIKYSTNRSKGIDAFYIYNDEGQKIPLYDSSKRSTQQDPNKALKEYDLVYRKPNNVRTLAGTFTVTESKYKKHAINKINKKDLEMITETTHEITIDEYHGFPVQILENSTVIHKIINLRDTTMVIPNKNSHMQKSVKIELTSYEENN